MGEVTVVKSYFKYALILIIVVAGLSLVQTKSAAAFALNPNPRPDGIPSDLADQLENCNYQDYAQSPAFWQWVSPNGAPAASSMTVPYGTTDVALNLNWASAVCSSPNYVPESRLETQSAVVTAIDGVPVSGPGAGSITGAAGSRIELANGSTQGDYTKQGYLFHYLPPSALTASHVFTIKFINKSINRVTNDSATPYKCVALPRPSANGGWNYSSCPDENPTFDIQVNVSPPSSIGSLDVSNCSKLAGWGLDPLYPNIATYVQVFKDGPAGSGQLIYSSQTNIDRPDVNAQYPGSGSTKHGFDYSLDQWADVYSHTYYVYALSASPPRASSSSILIGSPRIGPCIQVNCSLSTSPAQPLVNQPFDIILSYNFNRNYGSLGTPITPRFSVSYNGGPNQDWGSPGPTRDPGSHAFSGFSQSGPGGVGSSGTVYEPAVFTVSCTSGFNIASAPYLKVYGNDIAAGGKFADNGPTTCTAGPKTVPGQPPASIWAFNKKVTATGNYYGGASGQFGAFALGQIVRFNTAGERNGLPAPTTPNDLSFGNMIKSGSTPTAAGEDATGSSGIYRCIPDYFSASTKLPAPNASLTVGDPLVTSQGSPKIIGDSTQEVKFINGNAFIQANITYQNTSWASTSRIPSYYLIVKGDIYIDSNVTQLDGVYIAQPKDDGTGGTIYTCTNGGRNFPWLYSREGLFDNCQNNLTITGSFIANNIKFQRTRGTTQNSIPSATPAPTQLTMSYDSAGSPGGICMNLVEGGSPSWNDNFLCTNRSDLYWTNMPGISSSPGYRHAGDPCFSWTAQHNNHWAWQDNNICWPAASPNPQFSWSSTNDSSKTCTLIFEVADADPATGWKANSWLCVPRIAAPPYTPVNEVPTSGNIAEVFNFSQELYLAPTPSILDTVIGGGTSSNVYQSITSLPPVL